MVSKSAPGSKEFLLPDLGEGLEEAELIEWCVKEGQTVEEFDILAKMETDKALVEVPSPRPGTIATLHGGPGEFVKVGAPLVTFTAAAGAAGKPGAKTETKPEPAKADAKGKAKQAEPQEEEREDAGTVVGQLSSVPGVSAEPGKVLAAPAVRKLARDLGVEIDQVTGTGIGGRVTADDVQQAADGRSNGRTTKQTAPPRGAPAEAPRSAPAADGKQRSVITSSRDEWLGVKATAAPASARRDSTPARNAPAARESSPVSVNQQAGDERVPFRGIRRTIAERMRQSVNNAVHFSVMDEADVTQLDDVRRRLAAANGEKLSLLPFVAYAVCKVLSGHMGKNLCKLNASVDDEKSEIVQHKHVHLGIAADTESGLMVPVMHNADKLGVLEISRRIAQLANAARQRTIPREQLTGSTFTISNFGSYAGRFATPIINYPEVGILAVGRAREAVVVRNGMLGIGKLLPLSLTADHRVVDGATIATALSKVIELLQSPDLILPTR